MFLLFYCGAGGKMWGVEDGWPLEICRNGRSVSGERLKCFLQKRKCLHTLTLKVAVWWFLSFWQGWWRSSSDAVQPQAFFFSCHLFKSLSGKNFRCKAMLQHAAPGVDGNFIKVSRHQCSRWWEQGYVPEKDKCKKCLLNVTLNLFRSSEIQNLLKNGAGFLGYWWWHVVVSCWAIKKK